MKSALIVGLCIFFAYQPLFAELKLNQTLLAQRTPWNKYRQKAKADSAEVEAEAEGGVEATSGDYYRIHANKSRQLAREEAALLANYTDLGTTSQFLSGVALGIMFPIIGPFFGYYTIKGAKFPVYMGYRMIQDQGEEYFSEFAATYHSMTKKRMQDSFFGGAALATIGLVGIALLIRDR